MNDRRQAIRRNRVFRDWSHPLKRFDNVELDTKFRFRRQDVTDLTDEIKDDIELANRHDTLPPLLRVSTTLRFDASGSFQDVCGELAGVQQCTASWTITSVGTVWWKDRWQLGHTATCEIHSQTLKLYNHLAAKQAPTNIGSSAVSFSSDIASGARMDAQSTTTVISGWKYLPSQPRQLYLGENTCPVNHDSYIWVKILAQSTTTVISGWKYLPSQPRQLYLGENTCPVNHDSYIWVKILAQSTTSYIWVKILAQSTTTVISGWKYYQNTMNTENTDMFCYAETGTLSV